MSVYKQLKESLQISGHRLGVAVQSKPASLQGHTPYIKVPGI